MTVATFSAILDFAIRGETSVIEQLQAVVTKGTSVDREILARVRAEAEKTLQMFRTIQQEHITGTVVEPCEALEETSYQVPDHPNDPVAWAGTVLDMQIRFLADAARVINLREVKRALDKVGKKKILLAKQVKNRTV